MCVSAQPIFPVHDIKWTCGAFGFNSTLILCYFAFFLLNESAFAQARVSNNTVTAYCPKISFKNMTLVGNTITTAWNKTGGSMWTWHLHWGTNGVLMVWIGICCCSCSSNLHHLCGSPSYSLGSRDKSLSPARILGVELLNGCCTLNRKNQCSQSCLLSILESRQLFKLRTVTHPTTLHNLLLQVCGGDNQHTDSLQHRKHNRKKTQFH